MTSHRSDLMPTSWRTEEQQARHRPRADPHGRLVRDETAKVTPRRVGHPFTAEQRFRPPPLGAFGGLASLVIPRQLPYQRHRRPVREQGRTDLQLLFGSLAHTLDQAFDQGLELRNEAVWCTVWCARHGAPRSSPCGRLLVLRDCHDPKAKRRAIREVDLQC